MSELKEEAVNNFKEETKINNIERFEILSEAFPEVEREINTKKALNENNILQYGNIVLEKTMNQIQKEIEAIDSVFSLKRIGSLIKYTGMNFELCYSRGRILIELKFDTKKISFKHKTGLSSYFPFYLKVAKIEAREKDTISPEKYLEIFGAENPETLLTKAFQGLINRVLEYLETRLKDLKEENERIPILDFPFVEKLEEKQEQRIKIGEFEDYEVILEKRRI